MIRISIVQRLGYAAVTFALKIAYWVFVESLDYSFRARFMSFCLRIILIPASLFEAITWKKEMAV